MRRMRSWRREAKTTPHASFVFEDSKGKAHHGTNPKVTFLHPMVRDYYAAFGALLQRRLQALYSRKIRH